MQIISNFESAEISGQNMPTMWRFGYSFDVLVRLHRPNEPSSRPSPGGVEAGGHGSEVRKHKNPPRVKNRASKRAEDSELVRFVERHWGIIYIPGICLPHTKYVICKHLYVINAVRIS